MKILPSGEMVSAKTKSGFEVAAVAARELTVEEYLSKPENRAFIDSDRRPKPVICVETGDVYPSQQAAEKATGYSGIHKACKGQKYTSRGYHWKYA